MRKLHAIDAHAVVESYRSCETCHPTAGLLGSTAFALAIQAAGSGFRYLNQIIIARWLGALEFGSYSYASSSAQVLASIGVLGLGTAALRLIPEYIVSRQWPLLRGFLMGSVVVTTMATVGLVLLGAAAIFFYPSSLDRTSLLIGTLLAPVIALANLESDSLRGFRRIGMALIGPFVLQPVLEICFAFLIRLVCGSLRSPSAISARLVSLIIVVGLETWTLASIVPRELANVKSAYATREWKDICAPLLLLGLFTTVLGRADILVLGLLRDASEVGVYGAAMTSAALVGIVLMAANAKGAPTMAGLYAQGDTAGLEQIAHTITRFSLIAALATAIGLITFRTEILEFFGKGFAKGSTVLIILTAGQLCNACTGPVYYLLTMTGHQRESSRILGWAMVVDLALCLLLVPNFGMVGAAASSAIGILMWNIWHYIAVRRRLGIDTLGILPASDKLRANAR